MKLLIPISIITILLISGFGAANYQEQSMNSVSMDYTHTVLVEVGTATWCPSCPASNSAWHTIYDSANYDFEYTELVYDKNTVASTRFNEFNPAWVPTSYWDGGQYVYPGTNIATFYNYLDSSGARAVPDLVANLDVAWLGNAQMEISYSVLNNDVSNYQGKIRIYVIELESTLWNDYNGNPYYHAFLDFAINQVINIPAGGILSDTIIWNGLTSGYPAITQDNIQVILAVFTNTPHTSYSDPPSGNPFTAYYADETIAATPGSGVNNPPDTPRYPNPTDGDKNVSIDIDLTWTGSDPDNDDLTYDIYFGTNNPPSKIVSKHANSSYYIENLINLTTYYWEIVAWDEHGLSTTGPIWSFTTTSNYSPDKPNITGPTSGKSGKDIEYIFTATDSNDDELYYYILWGDGSTEDWIGPFASNEQVNISHQWANKGAYFIKAKVKDFFGAESEFAITEINIPRNKVLKIPNLLQKILEEIRIFQILKNFLL